MKYYKKPVKVIEDTYINNGRFALTVVDKEDRAPVCTATINMPEKHLEVDEVIIKDYSENQGVLEDLVSMKIISHPHRYIYLPHGLKAPVCRYLGVHSRNKDCLHGSTL